MFYVVYVLALKGCISDVGRRHFCWYLKQDPKQTEPAHPSLPRFVLPVKPIMNAAQNQRVVRKDQMNVIIYVLA